MRVCALGLVLVVLAGGCSTATREVTLERAPDVAVTVPAPTSSTTTTAPSPAPPTTTEPVDQHGDAATLGAAPAIEVGDRAWTVAPYRGLGVWLDAFDWSTEFSPSGAVVGPEAIDQMAAEGAQTLFIQAGRWNSVSDVIEPDRLATLLARAHAHGMQVVAWYLPTLEDLDADLRRLVAIAGTGVDGVAVDIEARTVADVADRNRRLIELSGRLRAALPGRTLGAIVLEPVLLEDVNPDYWPGFPWGELAPLYDVWMPMSYWTNRRGAWRAAYDYTATNVARVRERIGRPDAPVHPIGGIGDRTTVPDLEQMVTAAVDTGAIGGSIYDFRTTRPEFWPTLRAFRSA